MIRCWRSYSHLLFPAVAGAACLAAGLAPLAYAEPPSVSYNRDIRPILAEHCFQCHGQDAAARKAGLRIDHAEGATAVLPTGHPAIVPGDPGASVLYQRVTSADPGERMPPSKSGEALSKAETDLLGAWIASGAHYEKHWAYIKPVRPAVPVVRNAGWIKNPIDAFVLARLEEGGIAPAPAADRYTLMRRLSYDITGLPPAVEEVDAFVNDARPDAVAWAVDRLLASPRYGEHMARYWLDLARYADTNGYHIDTKRSMWPYRDWVINALNHNMSFDRFTVEQIAGDLLPDATLSQRIATGFHRNTMFNEEGGIDPEEFRTKAVVDRVNTTMTVWMGTTMSCTECHDHKYDPFTQREFYQLYSFFNNVPELGGGTNQSQMPQVSLPPDPTIQAELDALASVVADLERRHEVEEAKFKADIPAWEIGARSAATAWTLLTPDHAESVKTTPLTLMADGSILAGGDRPDTDLYTLTAPLPSGTITGLALEVIPDSSFPNQGPGRSDDGSFTLNEIEATAGQTRFTLSDARSVFEDAAYPAGNAVDGKKESKSGWSTGIHTGRGDSLVLRVSHDAAIESDSITIVLRQSRGVHLLGRFRLWVTSEPDVNALPAPHVIDVLNTDVTARTEAHLTALLDYYRSRQTGHLGPRLEALRAKRAALEAKAPVSLVMAEMETPRETHVHIRGNFLDPGEPVSAGVPAVLHAMDAPADRLPNRLDLANWLVSPQNPLTARVTMNRLWDQLFGRGLLDTVEDFGTRSALPSHPELLDWLAVEFMESGWDLKAMTRLIVSSATYQQSSAVGSDAYARDPHNVLLARGPRFRLDAEAIRDTALAVSGLLSPRIGGPSVFPYQPPGLWEEKLLTGYEMGVWPTTSGADLYRRGLYTFRRRSVPYPTFQSFDAPSYEFCVAKRARTNTPLQALTTLNDPQFVEAARVLAERLTRDTGKTVEDRIAQAMRMCLSRLPEPREIEYLKKAYDRQSARFTAEPAAAAALVANGRAPLDSTLSVAELAAWTVVANVILNLDETMTKG
ncbi:MAG: hypothetical protein AMXMBFR84_19140 [Candidatus Hydrogenedentota bacterium]